MPTWTLALDDDFTRADSSTLGAPWTTHVGQWGILSNQARSTSATGSSDLVAAATIPIRSAARKLLWEWDVISPGPCRHVVRWVDDENNVFVSGTNRGDDIYLFSVTGASKSILATSSGVAWGTSPTIEVTDVAGVIIVDLNGTEVLNHATAALLGSRRVGLSGSSQTASPGPQLTDARLGRFAAWHKPGGFRLGGQTIGSPKGGL